MAESPAALNAYHDTASAVETMTFTRIEFHLIWFAINPEHGRHYCMATHTPGAIHDDMPEALRTFTITMVQKRDRSSPGDIAAFLSAGYTKENIFGIIAIIARKIMTNYTNHIANTPLDDQYQEYYCSADETAE